MMILMFISLSFLITLIFTFINCVCNPKSRRFNKHKSFILSHDFNQTNNSKLNQTSEEQLNDIEAGNKLKNVSLNRALPDIPQPSNSNIVHNSNFSTIKVPKEMDSVYTSNNNEKIEDNIENHAYARIRNIVNDSSTENDTDDYSDPSTIVKNSFPSHLINRGENSENSINNSPFEIQTHSDLTRNDNVESIDIEINNDPKREVSYNTISVREPLAKVLAERDNIEHHYNEVEEERVSSFYEEINSGSVTYSKINESIKNSVSDSLPSKLTNNEELETNMENNTQLPIYSLVDKKSKKSYIFVSDDPPNDSNNSSNDLSNLYTKVIKQNCNDIKETSNILQRYSPPPPLPPPINKDQSKVYHRNTIMFGTSNIFSSERNFPIVISSKVGPSNSVNYNENYNLYKQNLHSNNSEKDPGYETVYKEMENNSVDANNTIDYGYEAIANDPAYEIVSTIDNGYETIKNESSDLNDDQSDPNYEIICNVKNSSELFNSNNTLSCSVSSDDVVIIEHL